VLEASSPLKVVMFNIFKAYTIFLMEVRKLDSIDSVLFLP
jgi:hypothetical protein